MALSSGLQPKGYSEIKTPEPKPFVALDGPAASNGGDLIPNPAPAPITIHIGDANLVAIIADLRARIVALEA